jgi:shikimate dehydrogenase/3-dehydroquinate dehydratase type I
MICIPITGNTHIDALRQIEMSLPRADILELRMDLIRDGDLRALIEKCRVGRRPIKVLVTYRRKGSSAIWEMSEERQRLALLKEAVRLDAEYVDMEVDTPEVLRNELLALVRDLGSKTRVIVSHHDFHGTPSLASLKDIVHECIQTGIGIVKIVTYAKSPADNLTVLSLIPYVRKKKKEVIAFCMGEQGRLSRIAAPLLGACLSYVSLTRGAESAPGQLTVDEMEQIMVRIDGGDSDQDTSSRSSDVQIFGIFGNPVKQSLSPLMHEAALDKMKINARYMPFCVQDLTSAISGIRGMGIRGVSVTIPFKVMTMAHLDEVDADAREIGAVNTIVNHHGTLMGFNTDWIGFVQALKEFMDIKGKVFAVLGAGGAARAAAFGIRKEGGMPVIVNRNVERGQYLAQEVECSFYHLKDITHVRADCLVNTTPVGMMPDIHETPVERDVLANYRWVMDMIYNPLKTKLLNDAENAGCITIPGIGMFVHQGAEQIKLWTGMEPSREAMKQVVMERLLYGN